MRRAQDLGFTLREIRELIDRGEATTADCVEVCCLTQTTTTEIDRKVADLTRMWSVLNGLRLAGGESGTCDRLRNPRILTILISVTSKLTHCRPRRLLFLARS